MITINNLYFSYNRMEPYLLDDISFTVNSGDYISILGENGSGKTTLLKVILKLLNPSRGDITIKTDKIGYVPQKNEGFNSQFPITVLELLDCHRKILKLKDKSAIEKSLEMVRMESFRNALIGTLSGGQRQRIFIARALMGNPELLILDEPSTGVDVSSQEEIYGTIKSLNKHNGITVLSVEHNLKAALTCSSLIYYMEAGRGSLYKPQEYLKMVSGGNTYATI